jgi:hypothetical protein
MPLSTIFQLYRGGYLFEEIAWWSGDQDNQLSVITAIYLGVLHFRKLALLFWKKNITFPKIKTLRFRKLLPLPSAR